MDKKWLVTKMREGAVPHDKPKIYISFCDRAIGDILKSVKDEILSVMDCVIYHRSGIPGEGTEEERRRVISDMNLVVVLITRDAVDEESIAFKEMFSAIHSLKIPILPIVVESISVEDINKTFQNRQYLYRDFVRKSDNVFSIDYRKTNSTGVYRKKLKEFLEDTLINKELYEKVKKEFAARIFLSYRKKDYCWVKNIGHLIMCDERFRDTAVWYDDYLIYGENFDESIKNAIVECDTFLLAITPNMVNEDNYVTSVEYPMAKKLNKNILPVVIEDVEQKKIQEKFPELGDTVKLEKHKEFCEKLIKLLKGYDTKKLDNSPEHLYLIGLAHYFGINVPKRSDEGFSIIKEAAERGCIDAIQRVGGICRGRGYIREAVEWQEKAVLAIERLHYNREALFKEKLKLSELYREYNEELKFIEVTNELVKKFKPQLEEEGIYESSMLELGKTLMKSGDFSESRKYFGAVIKAYKNDKSKTAELAETYRLLAAVYIEHFDFAQAESALIKADSLLKERDGESFTEERVRVNLDLEKLYETARKARSDIRDKRKYEYISTEELEKEAARMKMADACRVYTLIGERYMTFLPSAAVEYLKKAEQNLSRYDFLSLDAYAGEQAKLYFLTAKAYERSGDYKSAEEYYASAAKKYKTVKSHFQMYENEYRKCINALGCIYYKQKKYQDAIDTLEDLRVAYFFIRFSMTEAQTLEYYNLYITLGCSYEGIQEYFKAEEMYREAAKILRDAFCKFSSVKLKEDLAEVYVRLATVYVEREDCDSYYTYFKRAVKLYKETKTGILRRRSEAVYRHYADAFTQDRKFFRALYYYMKALRQDFFISDVDMIRKTVIYAKIIRVFADMKILPVAVLLLKKTERLVDILKAHEKKKGKLPFELPPTFYKKGLMEQSPYEEFKKSSELIERAVEKKQEKHGKR